MPGTVGLYEESGSALKRAREGVTRGRARIEKAGGVTTRRTFLDSMFASVAPHNLVPFSN